MTAAFVQVAHDDVRELRRRLRRREDELAAWVADLTPANREVYEQWAREHP